ncbi:hypothetical protein HDU96_007913 [Phlyctochytrium bullatum]|nr:hypothetical protein HDU96_007913 [Phlyctochytrium bullatum]
MSDRAVFRFKGSGKKEPPPSGTSEPPPNQPSVGFTFVASAAAAAVKSVEEKSRASPPVKSGKSVTNGEAASDTTPPEKRAATGTGSKPSDPKPRGANSGGGGRGKPQWVVDDDAASVSKPRIPQKESKLYKPDPTEPPKDGADFIAFDFADEVEPRGVKRKFGDREQRGLRALGEDGRVQSLDPLMPLPTPPWARDAKAYSKDPAEMFNQEAYDYIRYISPTAPEHAMRALTVERIRNVVRQVWGPECSVMPFGSFETGLYLPTSDVDVVVYNCPPPPACLDSLGYALDRLQIASKLELVKKARVPIIKMVDSLTGFAVDVSFNMTSGVQTAQIVKKVLSDQKCGAAIRGLMYLLKQFLAQRVLNEPFSGGLGSYALLLLVVAFVKMHPLVQTGEIFPEENMGTLFLEFLELYGNRFSYGEVGIAYDSEATPAYFEKVGALFFYEVIGVQVDLLYDPRMRRTNRKVGVLTLLDPQDNNNDVGAGAFNYFSVKAEFYRAYLRLSAMIGLLYDRGQDPSARRLSHSHRRFHDDGDSYVTDEDAGRPTTILGAVLAVRKGYLERRMEVQELAARVFEGGADTGLAPSDGNWWERVNKAQEEMPPPVAVFGEEMRKQRREEEAKRWKEEKQKRKEELKKKEEERRIEKEKKREELRRKEEERKIEKDKKREADRLAKEAGERRRSERSKAESERQRKEPDRREAERREADTERRSARNVEARPNSRYESDRRAHDEEEGAWNERELAKLFDHTNTRSSRHDDDDYRVEDRNAAAYFGLRSSGYERDRRDRDERDRSQLSRHNLYDQPPPAQDYYAERHRQAYHEHDAGRGWDWGARDVRGWDDDARRDPRDGRRGEPRESYRNLYSDDQSRYDRGRAPSPRRRGDDSYERQKRRLDEELRRELEWENERKRRRF